MIGLAKTSAPSFKKQPDKFSKPAAIDKLVFLKIFKMVLSETKRISLNAFVMLKDSIQSKLIWGWGDFSKVFQQG